MPSLLRIFLVVAALMAAAPHASAERLLVAAEPWPPYAFDNGGAPAGSDYEVARSVLASLGLELEMAFQPLETCCSLARMGLADAVLDVGYSEARARFLSYPDEPLSRSETVLFYRVDKMPDFADLDEMTDLSGLMVGTHQGYAYSLEFRGATHFERSPSTNLRQTLSRLLLGEVDVVAANRDYGVYLARRLNIDDMLRHTDWIAC